MLRAITVGFLALVGLHCPLIAANPIRGKYVEARTCQVYTGPCFANGEVGSTGKDAIMIWRIDGGSFAGVDLSGHLVAAIVKTSHTLGFNGFGDAESTRAIVIVDRSAGVQEQAALKGFVLSHTGIHDRDVAAVQRADIRMQFDVDELAATVTVGDMAHLETRKARKGDCICSNESAYYPPLTKLLAFAPGVTIEGEVTARRLSTRWSIPDSRTAYMGLFSVETTDPQVAAKL
jgi:hypothetical protein